jgi:hypothetical protein
MSVITGQMVSVYANYLLGRIEQDDEAMISPALPGVVTADTLPGLVTMDGLTGSFHVTDSDGSALEVTIRPVHRDRDNDRVLSFTRAQVQSWAGRELSDDELSDLEDAVPNSTFPETVGLIADALDRGERPRTETDCACPVGDSCPCQADGEDGLCACCRAGDHNGRDAEPGR